jgi:PAS domain S-box-containing protein
MKFDEKWFVVICDDDFLIIDQLIVKNIDIEFSRKDLLAKVILPEDMDKFLDFIMVLKNEKSIFGYEISLLEASGAVTVMYFGGVLNDGKFIITAFSNYIALYEQLISINNDQANLLREKMKALYSPTLDFTKLTMLNNEIVNMQRELKKKNRELMIKDKAISASLNAIVFIDLNKKITYVNKAFLNLLGYENKEEILGCTSIEFIENFKDYEKTKSVLFENGSCHGEMFIKKKDKSLIYSIFTSNLIYSEQGKPISIMVSFLDITERNEMEKSLIKSKKEAEAANILKSNFLANMSHEIRTPMNGIIGFLELLENTTLNRDQIEYINYIKTSTDNLLNVINDILDVSKIEAGKLELEKISFDLHLAVENTVLSFAARAAQKGLDLNMLINSDVPQFVIGDPTRLKQVISNLINNAIKYTDKGYVMLQVEIKERLDSGYIIRFSVEDTGIGMTEEVMNKIFKPFSQADESSNRKYGGSGLGLTICDSIVKMMDGNIRVESTELKGSKFIFEIKVKEETNKKNSNLVDYSVLKGKKIMVVDDNYANRNIAKIYLQEANCMVNEAESAVDALTKLVRNEVSSYNAILIDYSMPNMNGLDLASALKAIPMTKEIPLILLTSIDFNKEIQDARSIGLLGYLSKPYKRKDLLDCISMVLKGEEYIDGNEKTFVTKGEILEATKNELKVLLVEDNDINRSFFIKLLKLLGINYNVALNGEEAVKACKNENYDIVFMDCQMPIMDGYEATKRIRQFEGNIKHTVIVAMTAFAMKDDAEKCITAGMDDYLSKPVKNERVQEIIEKYSKKTVVIKNNNWYEQSILMIIDETGFDRNTAESLLKEGIVNIKMLLSEIQKSMHNSDFEDASQKLHQLKGVVLNLRLNGIFEAVMKARDALKEGSIESSKNIILGIIKMLDGF